MPEGDTVFRLAKRLGAAMMGREVVRFSGTAPKLANVDRAGRRIVGVRARGKHLLMDFDDGRILHTHLRMKGSWQLVRNGERWRKPAWAASVVMGLAGRGAREVVGFNLAIAELLASEASSRLLRELGPDLLSPDFDPQHAIARLRRENDLPIGVALMRQNLVSGIGNVYKSELLFLERIDPFASVSAVADEALEALLLRARKLMKRNLAAGAMRTTRKRYEGRLWIYGRSRELCRVCGGSIRMRRQGDEGRSTYFCPDCQSVGEWASGSA